MRSININEFDSSINSFLNLLNLKSTFIDSKTGIVKDEKESICGKTNVLKMINTEDSFSIQTNIVHSYGGIRLRLDTNSYPNILQFEINQEKSRQLKGRMVSKKIEDSFIITEFEMTTYEKEQPIQDISILEYNKAFSYHNDKTGDKVNFFKQGQLEQEERMVLSSSFQENAQKKMKLIISATEDNKEVRDINLYDRRTGNHYDTSSLKKKISQNEKIYEQYEFILQQLNPTFYNRMEEMLNSYQYNEKNIIFPVMRQVLLKKLTEDASICLLGKKLVKEINATKK